MIYLLFVLAEARRKVEPVVVEEPNLAIPLVIAVGDRFACAGKVEEGSCVVS